MRDTYIANRGEEEFPISDVLKIPKYMKDFGYDIYVQHTDGSRELVAINYPLTFYKDVVMILADGREKIIATPKEGWIGL